MTIRGMQQGDTHNRNILELNTEVLGTVQEVVADTRRDDLTVRDELGRVELGDDGLEHLVSDRGEDTLVVAVLSAYSTVPKLDTHSCPRFW